MQENKIYTKSELDGLYRDFFTPLFRYFFFRTKDYDIANDLTQSSFLKFMRQENKPNDLLHIRKLIFTIARTTLIDYWRSNSKRIHDSLDVIGDVDSGILNPEDIAIRKEDTEYLHSILGDLSDIESDIVSMRMSYDIEYKVIADTLSLSESNARKIYSRALKKIESIIIKDGRYN